MSALAPHRPPRLSDRDFATQVEDTLQSCTEAKRVRWWVHYKKLAPLLPDTVTEQMLKTYASADTPKMGSFAERGVPPPTRAHWNADEPTAAARTSALARRIPSQLGDASTASVM